MHGVLRCLPHEPEAHSQTFYHFSIWTSYFRLGQPGNAQQGESGEGERGGFGDPRHSDGGGGRLGGHIWRS